MSDNKQNSNRSQGSILPGIGTGVPAQNQEKVVAAPGTGPDKEPGQAAGEKPGKARRGGFFGAIGRFLWSALVVVAQATWQTVYSIVDMFLIKPFAVILEIAFGAIIVVVAVLFFVVVGAVMILT